MRYVVFAAVLLAATPVLAQGRDVALPAAPAKPINGDNTGPMVEFYREGQIIIYGWADNDAGRGSVHLGIVNNAASGRVTTEFTVYVTCSDGQKVRYVYSTPVRADSAKDEKGLKSNGGTGIYCKAGLAQSASIADFKTF